MKPHIDSLALASRMFRWGGLTLCIAVSAPAWAQTLSVAATTVQPKSTVKLAGSGYQSRELVDVYFNDQAVLLGATDRSGSFGPYAFKTPSNALPGTHWVTAVGRKTQASARLALTVQTNSNTYQFDAARTGFNRYENVVNASNVSTLGTAWTRSAYFAGDYFGDAVAVADGRVYGATYKGSMYALKESDGSVLWVKDLRESVRTPPAVLGNVVLVASDTGYLLAMDAATGEAKTSFVWTGKFSTPLVIGNVFYTVNQGEIKAVKWDLAAGHKILWRKPMEPTPVNALAAADGALYVATTNGTLYAFNASDGTALWSVPGLGVILNSPMVANGVVYVISDLNLLTAIHAKTGARIWSTVADTVFNQSMAAAHGLIYVPCSNQLCAIDQVTGEFRWQTRLTYEYLAGPVLVANGLVYTGGPGEGELFAVDARTGDLKATLHTGTGGPMAVANGRLYVGSLSGELKVLAVNGGAGPASLKQPSPPEVTRLQPDLRLTPAVAVVSPASASN